MEQWKEYKIGDIAKTNTSQYSLSENWETIQYLDTGSITKNQISGIEEFLGNTDLPSRARRKVRHGDIVFSCVRPNLCHYGYIDNPPANLLVSTGFAVITVDPNLADARYIYYFLTQNSIVQSLHTIGEQAVSTYPSIRVSDIEDLSLSLPSLPIQHKIASILKSLDDKIEVNRRINDNFYYAFFEVMLVWSLTSLENDNLEKQAQALFKSWFVDFEPFKDGEFVESEFGLIPKGWKVVSLSDIADYINGLAMQKYRPQDNESGLPVLKIKELGQGRTDESSELCSPSLIGSKYIIDDGDIIFSWSGTLMVKVWCGGKCGLNQHLFVVEPKELPQWFVYQWTKHHLDNFIHIAKDKAVTMGHIKRGELDKAKVVVPNKINLANIDLMMKPLHNQIISNMKESRRLASLRDTLLPRLMSGELKVNEIENVI